MTLADGPVLPNGSRGRAARPPCRDATADWPRLRGPPRASGSGRPAVRRPLRPSALLRLHPGCRDLAGGARRPDRRRDEHRFRGVARIGRPEPARADRPRLVPRLDRLPDERCRRPGVGRLGGEPDCDRLRPRERWSGRCRRGSSPTPATRPIRPWREPPVTSGSGRIRSGCCATDREFRIRPDDVSAAMDVDLARRPPPVPRHRERGHDQHRRRSTRCRRLAAICRDRGVWLHVDGAYGAFAVLTERGRRALAGMSSWPTRSLSIPTNGWRCPSRSAA